MDASSSLHSDDLATVDALRAASVPALVVPSKTDPLREEADRELLLDYTRKECFEQRVEILLSLQSASWRKGRLPFGEKSQDLLSPTIHGLREMRINWRKLKRSASRTRSKVLRKK